MVLGITNNPSQNAAGAEVRKQKKPAPGIADYITGEARSFVNDLRPYLPQELIGGVLPQIAGLEEEAVWNAAFQACATEKVHYCFSTSEGRIWYLACPSASLSSHPNSGWCPLAAALPGNSEYWDQETVYIYEQEGFASALRWDPETHRMQVYLGSSRTILPRIQTMDANFVTINPEVADIVPWQNRELKSEKLSRATITGLLLAGLATFMIALSVLVINFTSINFMKRDLSDVKIKTDEAAHTLIMKSLELKQSETARHMATIQTLIDDLVKLDGIIVKYEVDKGKVQWEAVVPQALANTFVENYNKKGAGAKADEGAGPDGRIKIKGSSF